MDSKVIEIQKNEFESIKAELKKKYSNSIILLAALRAVRRKLSLIESLPENKEGRGKIILSEQHLSDFHTYARLVRTIIVDIYRQNTARGNDRASEAESEHSVVTDMAKKNKDLYDLLRRWSQICQIGFYC